MATGLNGDPENTESMTEVQIEGEQPSPERMEDKNKTPRNPRWTRDETLILIEVKKIAEERGERKGRRSSSAIGSENKWDFVSSICKQRGVNRGPVQCRKRWSNLASDFKKINLWELRVENQGESYWTMRTDLRRERKLPGFFDREVYDIWDVKKSTMDANQLALVQASVEENNSEGLDGMEAEDLDEMTEDEETEEEFGAQEQNKADGKWKKIHSPTPISEMRYQSFYQACPNQGESPKPPGSHFWRGSGSQEGAKRRRQSSSDCQNGEMGEKIIKALERNSELMNEVLQAQNLNSQREREQRKDHHDNIVGALTKISDALEKIANKK